MAERKIGTTTVRVALNILCSKLSKNDIIELLAIDPSEWEDLKFTGKCFKKSGSSTENIIFATRNDCIMLGNPQYGRNINLQQLGSKGGNQYITNQQFSMSIDEESYKNPRIAIPDLNATIDVYEHTEDYDPTSKGLRFDVSNARLTDSLRMHLIYEDEDNVTRELVLGSNMVKPYNCTSVIQFLQLGSNIVFDTKSEFSWQQQVGEYSQSWWSISDILTLASVSTYGYKYIDGFYSINCRVYDDISKARIDDPKESENATDEGDEDSARDYTELYLKATVYRSINSTRTNKTKVETHEWRFKVAQYDKDGKEIDKWKRTVIGFVRDGQSGHYNLAFLNNPNKVIEKITLDGVEQSIVTFPWLTPVTTYTENKEDTIQDQTYYYWSDINTNMYIFDTLAHAQDALEGLMDGLVKTFQGDDLVKTDLNDNNLAFDTDMSDVFVLSPTDVRNLAHRFNAQVDAQGNLFADLFVGLSMHQNPIDCNIDLFEIPIDVTPFCTTDSYTVKFSPSVAPTPEENNPTA